MARDLTMLSKIERKVLWLSCYMIHAANHLREPDEVKIGGHQASSASMVQILTALYFRVLKPEDRVAVKPHASPVFHAIQYLAGHQSLAKLKAFRGWGGAQSYPSRTKDGPMVDFSTGSVGLGVAITAFSSLIQDYVAAKGWRGDKPMGRMIALVGDAELDEGNVYECLQEGWKHGLRNTWWIIDYNRQSLDGVVREGLYDRIAHVFRAFGWEIVTLKYGALQRAAFQEPGGETLRQWIDNCPNPIYSALAFQGGAAWRKRIMDEIGDQGDVTALLDRRSDAELAALMENLGGHCLETLIDAFERVDHDRPIVFIAYTIKGWGTPLAGHKDNHAGLMTPSQMAAFQKVMGVPEGTEWDPAGGLDASADEISRFIASTPYFAPRPARAAPAPVALPPMPKVAERTISTQAAFGKILDGLAREKSELAARIVTSSPDVTVSTNLGPWVNRRGLFAREAIADFFRQERVPSAQKWQFSPEGQHIELGIAEMNLFLLLGAAGLSGDLFDAPLFPVGTLYDPFIARGLDGLTYACYQGARFLLAATPSGITLAPEGGAHQSINSPLIGMSQDGLTSFEPAFADELGVMMGFAFAHMQRRGAATPDPRTSLPDEAGGATYVRLTTRPLEQPIREMTDDLAAAIIDGAYWLREPSPSAEIIVAVQGVVAHEAIQSAAMIAEGRRDVGVLVVTSADRLHAGWVNARRARADGIAAECVVERLLAPLPRHCGIVTVLDGHPATLSWLGAVHGHRVAPLGVDHFGQTGRIDELYHHYGIDAEGIARAADGLMPRRLRLAAG
ncbi:transketolase [Acuticoccus mangrovi]|uniref:Pyruvate dehydrogenase E1 component n=1 Tax=Acuticoccus mangrovi TaxID=2796142 RepID=A0A934IMF5_9HYPH|nr:transketolase [Acuticoccus mangrovi]MBJ3777601.1 transketolase [Acuticoccus mangrovi]